MNNLAISASAGAGKTFQLVHRYLGLLAQGADPKKIIALTFSRKAAGEMFDRVIQALAPAANDEKEARQLSQRLQDCQFISADCTLDQSRVTRLLRNVLEAAHQLRIGTLDSFLVNIVQTFPFEFGLSGELNILEGDSETLAKQEVLSLVLQRLKQNQSRDKENFLEEFRRATFGQDNKSFSAGLRNFIDPYHQILLEADCPELWGRRERIWPNGWSWPENPACPETELQILQETIRAAELDERTSEKCQDFFSVLEQSHPLAGYDRIKYLYEKIAAAYPDLKKGGNSLKIGRRTLTLDKQSVDAVKRIFEHVTGRIIESHLDQTQGLYRILSAYENVYRETVRRNGRLTFLEIAFLLGRPELDEQHNRAAPILSSIPNQADRLFLDYRLDGRFDHWLLDEFQDTSTLQWRAIANLVDEVIQDQDGERSFFFVGDVKQAIYQWRGGDPRLFDQVRKKYQPVLESRPLARSYRSTQPVIDLVNRVFDDPRQRDLNLDPQVWDFWEATWQHHYTARGEPGFAAVYSLERPENKRDRQAQTDRFTATLHILQKTHPLERGLTVAALVNTNDQGERLTGFLRDAHIPAQFAGKSGILDTPLNAALIELIKVAEHPGDTFAWRHLQMSPLHPVLPQTARPPSELVASLLDERTRTGIESLLRRWAGKIINPTTDYENKKLAFLFAAVREFELGGGGRASRMLQFLEKYELEEGVAGNPVQVMTIHKAKGLQFDMVLLPCLDRTSGIDTLNHKGLHIEKIEDIDRHPEWVLSLPQKIVAESDPVLAETHRGMTVEATYEALCRLYVAMTRARHGLYIIRTEPPPTSKTVYASTVMASGLEQTNCQKLEMNGVNAKELYRNGDEDWLSKIEQPPPTPQKTMPNLAKETEAPAPNRRRYPRKTPSGDETQAAFQAAWLFDAETERYAQFGEALHAFISRIKWSDDEELDLNQIYEQAMQTLNIAPDIARKAFAQLRNALQQPAIYQALAKPRGKEPVEIWREQRFEMILDNHWVSGCFDRVVLEYNGRNKPVAGTITDFKTSVIRHPADLEKARQTYTPQLETYRRALTRITSLEVDKINTQLVFTSSGEALTCH